MARICLLHWKAAEAGAHLRALEAAGHRVDYQEVFVPSLLQRWRESPPDAFVIDLSRLPSHGREIAIALRQSPRTRHIPLVFCGGEEEKIARVRKDLPDASYCTLRTLRSTVRKALTVRPVDPVKPVDMMARYASRTAAQKLGVKPASKILVIDPPRDLARVLGELPPEVEILEDGAAGGASVTLCFIRESDSLLPRLSEVRPLAATTKLWIVWRKGGSRTRGDVTEAAVREQAIDLGLVDYKICSVNQVWSAMLFAHKRHTPTR